MEACSPRIVLILLLAAAAGACDPARPPSARAGATAAPATPGRMTPDELRARQRAAMDGTVLHPRRSVNPYVYAARDLVQGRDVAIDDLPVDYWRWPLVWLLHERGAPGADGWFEQWLDLEGGAWQRQPYGSLNHQLARSGGLYAAARVLGSERAARHGSGAAGRAQERLRDVLAGRWWDAGGPWDGHETTSAGLHPETTRSRHYAARDWTYLWAIADLADDETAALAARELDRAAGLLRQGVRPDGLWDEGKLPRFRADRDQMIFPEVFGAFGLTCHPSQTQVIAFILFPGVPWRPEFQGHNDRGGGDERHEQWSDYIFVGGRRWRPPA